MDKFKAETVQVCYIYSFFLRDFDFEKGKQELESWKDVTEEAEAKTYVSLKPYLRGNLRFLLHEGEEKDVEQIEDIYKRNSNGKVTLRIVTKIFENGAGIVRFELTLQRECGFEALSQLGTLARDERAITVEGRNKSLRSLFEESVDEWARECDAPWLEKGELRPLLKKKRNRLLRVISLEKGLAPQVPFPLIILEIGKETKELYEGLFDLQETDDEIKKMRTEVAKLILLSRREPDEGRLVDFKVLTKEKSLKNMYGVKNFFINFGYKAAVVMHLESLVKEDKEELRVLTKETFELIRLKWYLYGLLNVWMDKRAEEISLKAEELSELREKPVAEKGRFLEDLLTSLISDRTSLLRAMEDPILYRIGSASLNEIYDHASDLFRYADMEAMLHRKLDIIDKLQMTLSDLGRVQELVRISQRA